MKDETIKACYESGRFDKMERLVFWEKNYKMSEQDLKNYRMHRIRKMKNAEEYIENRVNLDRFNPVGMVHFVATDFNPWIIET